MIPIEISIGASAYDWWDLIPAATGGIIGALAGGIAAYFLAIRASIEARKERLEAKRQKDAAKLFRLFSTISVVINSLANTVLTVRGMYENASNLVSDRHPKQRVVREIANLEFEEYARIDPDDFAILFEADQTEFASDLQTIVNQFNSVQSSLRKFNQAKREVVDHLMLANEHFIGENGEVTSRLDDAHKAKLVLLEARCESIIAPTLENIIHVANLAIDAGQSFRNVAAACIPELTKVPGFPIDEVNRLKDELPELRHGL